MPAIAEYTVVSPVREHGTERTHCNPVNKEHDKCEYRKTEPTVCYNAVDFIRFGELSRLLFLVAVLYKGSDEDITLVCDDGLGVVIKFFFSRFDVFFNVLFNIVGKVELCKNFVVALKNLDCVPTLLFLRHIMYSRLFDMRQSMFNHARENVHRKRLCVLCRINSRISRLHYAVAFKCGDLNNLNPEFSRKFLDVDFVAVLSYNVHHVDSHNNGNAEFGQLGRKIKVSFEVRTVNDVQNRVRTFADKIISCNNFLQGVGGKGINTGKVGYRNTVMFFKFTFLFLNRYSRPVTYELVRAGQSVEQRCFTAVRVTRKGNSQIHLLIPLFHD